MPLLLAWLLYFYYDCRLNILKIKLNNYIVYEQYIKCPLYRIKTLNQHSNTKTRPKDKEEVLTNKGYKNLQIQTILCK